MTPRETVKDILAVGGNELQEASLPAKVMLGATACGLAFEWGTGNEALLGLIGGHIYEHTHQTLATALVTGGVSFTEQSILGVATAVSIHNFPKIMGAIRLKMGEKYEKPEKPEVSKELELVATSNQTKKNVELEQSKSKTAELLGRFVTVFALGTSVTELIDNSKEKRSISTNMRRAVLDAGLIAGGVVGIAATAATATNLGRSLGLEQQADTFVSFITSPFTYIGLFGLKLLNDFKNRRKRASNT